MAEVLGGGVGDRMVLRENGGRGKFYHDTTRKILQTHPPPPSRDKYRLAPTQVLRIMGYHASRGKIPVYITGLLIFTPN